MKNYRSRVNKILLVYLAIGLLWLQFSCFLAEKFLSPFNILFYSFLFFLVLSSLGFFYFFRKHNNGYETKVQGGDLFKNDEFQKNNQRLIEIIENTSDLVAIATMQGEGIYLNKAGMKLMEADEKNKSGVRKFADCHPQEVQDLIMKEAIPYAMKHGSWVGETSFITRTGKIIPTSQVVVVHKSQEGKPEYISTIARDLTRAKEAERMFVETAKLNQIFSRSLLNSPLGVIFWSHKNGKSKVLDWNASAQKILGHTPEEAIGKDLLDLVPPEEQEAIRPLIDGIVKNLVSDNYISPGFNNKTGKKRMINWFITPVKDPLNDTVYVLSLMEDITQKAEVEEELREKEERWQLAVKGNNEGIYDWDVKSGKLFLSQRYKEILGYEEHEGPNTLEEAGAIIHSEDIASFSSTVQDYLAKKIPEFRSEHRKRCKDGSYKWISITGLAIWDDQGRPVRMVGSLTDIAERKKIEAHLRMIESVVLSVNDGVVITKVVDDLTNKPEIIYVNRSFTKITGYSREEAVGKAPGLLGGMKTDLDVLAEIFDFIRQKKEGYKNQLIVYRKDGSDFWIEFSIDPIFEKSGKINYWVWVVRDITKRKEAEQELKKINFELDSFVYRASHDLRAPLTSIIGLVNISSNEKDLEVVKSYFNMISESAKKLDRYIINLLSLSRNSRLEVSNEEIDFEEIINESFDELRYMKNAELIKLTYRIDKSACFYSDSLRLKVIFKNLLSNAIKYQNTKSEGSFLEISINIEEALATIMLADNGIGISDSIKDKVFDMFYRGTEISDGSGLGLYIVKNVLEKMNGTIHISSNSHRGSNIVITVPNHKENK